MKWVLLPRDRLHPPSRCHPHRRFHLRHRNHRHHCLHCRHRNHHPSHRRTRHHHPSRHHRSHHQGRSDLWGRLGSWDLSDRWGQAAMSRRCHSRRSRSGSCCQGPAVGCRRGPAYRLRLGCRAPDKAIRRPCIAGLHFYRCTHRTHRQANRFYRRRHLKVR